MEIALRIAAFGLFAAAHFLWVRRMSLKENGYERNEKVRAISVFVGFLSGMFAGIIEDSWMFTAICLLGMVLSEFGIAIVFYENFKNCEIPLE